MDFTWNFLSEKGHNWVMDGVTRSPSKLVYQGSGVVGSWYRWVKQETETLSLEGPWFDGSVGKSVLDRRGDPAKAVWIGGHARVTTYVCELQLFLVVHVVYSETTLVDEEEQTRVGINQEFFCRDGVEKEDRWGKDRRNVHFVVAYSSAVYNAQRT